MQFTVTQMEEVVDDVVLNACHDYCSQNNRTTFYIDDLVGYVDVNYLNNLAAYHKMLNILSVIRESLKRIAEKGTIEIAGSSYRLDNPVTKEKDVADINFLHPFMVMGLLIKRIEKLEAELLDSKKESVDSKSSILLS